jgi:dolichol-phosphate mannosyltransferase
LPKLLERAREGHDVVVASRYVEGGGAEGWSFWRRLISRGATLLAHALLPQTRKVKDLLSGFFLLKKSVVEGVELNPTGYKLLLEVLVRGRYGSVVEVPYVFKARRRGRSKLGLKEVFDYVVFLFKLMRQKQRVE